MLLLCSASDNIEERGGLLGEGGRGGGVFWRMLIATNGLEEVSLHNPVILPSETMLVQPDLLLISIFGDAHCTTHICIQTNVHTDIQYWTLQMLGVYIEQTIGLIFAMHKLCDHKIIKRKNGR